ncbi:MAG TPA: sensor histidine kinase [Phenylobacterium sp.]|jgi:two-component sensor histidine kinase
MLTDLSNQAHEAPVVVLTVAHATAVLDQVIPDGVIMDAFPDAPPVRDRRELLSDELHHRIQNTLAIVLSLARITARSCKTIEEFQGAFGDRVQAMAKTNALLLRGNDQAINVRNALELELAPYVGRGKMVLQCASLAISANSALSLSLLIHELATNAAKYGGLSTAGGSLYVTCKRGELGGVLTWRETTDNMAPRKADGAGSILIERLARDLGGDARLDFRAEGLEAIVTFKLDAAGGSDALDEQCQEFPSPPSKERP